MATKISMSDVLKKMKKKKTMLVDVLNPEYYEKVHLKGAINIPIDRLEEEVKDRIDPETPVITYGIDYESPVSKIAAEMLENLGYKDVSYYAGGRKEWLESEMPVEKSD